MAEENKEGANVMQFPGAAVETAETKLEGAALEAAAAELAQALERKVPTQEELLSALVAAFDIPTTTLASLAESFGKMGEPHNAGIIPVIMMECVAHIHGIYEGLNSQTNTEDEQEVLSAILWFNATMVMIQFLRLRAMMYAQIVADGAEYTGTVAEIDAQHHEFVCTKVTGTKSAIGGIGALAYITETFARGCGALQTTSEQQIENLTWFDSILERFLFNIRGLAGMPEKNALLSIRNLYSAIQIDGFMQVDLTVIALHLVAASNKEQTLAEFIEETQTLLPEMLDADKV